MNLIDQRILRRASRALRCLPLNYDFYANASQKGLTANKVFYSQDQYKLSNAKWFLSINSVEDAFCWLIMLGILRREVDGQGLTAKVRLTPLGRELIETNPSLPAEAASYFDHLKNFCYRKWPLR